MAASLTQRAHHRAHKARQRQRGVLSGVRALLVQVADVDLNACVISRRDQAVSPAALARNVQVDVLACRGGASAAAAAAGESRWPRLARLAQLSPAHPRHSASWRQASAFCREPVKQ